MPKTKYVLNADYKWMIRGTIAIIEDAQKQRDADEYIYYAIKNCLEMMEMIVKDMEGQDRDS